MNQYFHYLYLSKVSVAPPVFMVTVCGQDDITTQQEVKTDQLFPLPLGLDRMFCIQKREKVLECEWAESDVHEVRDVVHFYHFCLAYLANLS